MPLTLSTVAIEEKNKLSTDSAFLVLLAVTIPGTSTVIRVVNNTEDVLWGGYTWTRTQFDLQTISTGSTGEVSQVELKVDNSTKILEGYVHTYEAWCKVNYREPITCTIYVINSLNLERVVTLNGSFEIGTTTPWEWEGVDLEEADADAWVEAGQAPGVMALRVVRGIGNGADVIDWQPEDVVTFSYPYPYWFTTGYWSKGTDILADGVGTQTSRMTADIVWADDSATSHADTDVAVPTGSTDWAYREYTHIGAQGIKSIRPYFSTQYQSGTIHLDNVETTVGYDTDAEVEYDLQLIQPKATPTWISFTLGAQNPFNRRYPMTRLIPVCPWKFKDADTCQYAGAVTTCNKTWDACKALGNTTRWRGFFAIGGGL